MCCCGKSIKQLLMNSAVRSIQFADWSTFSSNTSAVQLMSLSPPGLPLIHGITSLTVLVRRVLHSVGPIAFVCDVGIRVGAWWIGDAGFDMAAAAFVVSPGIHCEMGGHFPQDACIQEHTTWKHIRREESNNAGKQTSIRVEYEENCVLFWESERSDSTQPNWPESDFMSSTV